MKIFKTFIILAFFISVLFVNGLGQLSPSGMPEIDISKIDTTKLDPKKKKLLGELLEKQKFQNIGLLEEQKFQNIELFAKTKEILSKYYGRTNFDAPEWIRVKDFLTWLENNKDGLNKKFAQKKLGKLSEEEKENYIGAFLGAHYITRKMLNKDFNLSISLSSTTCASDHHWICISPNNFVDAIDGAMHEAVHMFFFIRYGYDNRTLMDVSKMLPEAITVFSQIKFGLPIKEQGNDIRYGTRATFTFADDEFVKKHLDEFMYEYSEIVYSVTDYSQYLKNGVLEKLYFPNQTSAIVDLTLRSLILNRIFTDYKLDSIDVKFALNPVYKDTVKEIMPIFKPFLEESNHKTEDELVDEFHQFFDEHLQEIAMIFVKNLKKYADPNIPPVPKGYI